MSQETLISYAENGEDVVLWRALGHVIDGIYVDVGAYDPVDLSVTKALYDRGWRGIDIDAVPEYADRLARARPGNDVVQAAITDRPVDVIAFHQLIDTGLSTLMDGIAEAHEEAGFTRRDLTVPVFTLDAVCERSTTLRDELHVLKIDAEGAEAEVLRSFDLGRWKPWVVVVEATRPLSDEPSYEDWDPILRDAGYTFTLFDGLSRFYASPEHPELLHALSYPACSLDNYTTARQHRQDVLVDELTARMAKSEQDAFRWRHEAVGYWADAMARVQKSRDAVEKANANAARLRRQLAKSRAQLHQIREDRRRLRDRVKRLETRIETMQQSDGNRGGSAHGRLRSAVRKVIGA